MLDTTLSTKINIAKDANFHFGIPDLPLFSMFTQSFEMPQVSLGVAVQPTPLVEVKHPGDKIVFDDLTITFLVDEELENYMEIFRWMMHLGYPRTTNQYKRLVEEDTVYRRKMDLQCSILTNKMNFKKRIVFVGAFPVTLSSLPFQVNSESVQHLEATCTFAYDYHFFESDPTV